MLSINNLKKTSTEHINIAYDVIFENLSSKAGESILRIDKFLKEEIAGNINIIYAVKERFEIDPEKKKATRHKRHLQELISRFGRMATAIEDFSELTPFNDISIYDNNGVIITAFHNSKDHYRLGAYLDFVKGGTFVSFKTQEDKFNLLRGTEYIDPIPLPKCVEKEFNYPVPEETTAFFSVFEGMPVIKLVAPIKHYGKLLGVCVAYIIIDENKIKHFSKHSQTEINFFAGTNLSVGTLHSEKTLSRENNEESYVIDFLNFNEIPSGAINRVTIGEDKEFYQKKLLISEKKTHIGGITVNYSCQYENEQLKSLLLIVLAIGAFFGLFVFVISIVLSGKIVKPIERLEQSVINYEKDGFTILPVTSNDEVGNLTVSFNSMVKQIEENIGKITSETIERRHAEYALLKSEEKYKNLISEIPDVVWSSNQAGETIYISPNVEIIYGYSPKEIYEARGKLFLNRIHPDDVKNVNELYSLLFTEKKKFDVEYRIKRKDGKWVWLHDRAASVYEENGTQFATGIFSDVTDKKIAEEKLKNSEQRNRALLQSVPDTICLFDKNGVCLEYKAEKHTPLLNDPDWYIGKNITELLPENIARQAADLLQKALHTGNTQMSEYELTFPDEKLPRYFDARISPISGKNQALILVRDITDNKRSEVKRLNLERQVLHAQKLESLGILAGGIAHDFNNILMGVLGYTDLSLRELPPQSPVRNNLMEINKAACRAAELAKQMLAYSGKGKFIIESICLNAFIDEMSHILEVSITKKAVLKFDYSLNLPTFKGDATQIRQIIMNLITNASESLEEKNGVIAVSTGIMFCDRNYLDLENFAFLDELDETLQEGNYVYIEVSDTGCGMTNDVKEKIFDPFFTTKFTGRGLGMAAVLGIVRGHKGVIKLHSVQGKGATFKILFPVENEPVKLKKNDSGSQNNEKILEAKGSFLIADDEETVRAVGKHILESIGFDVLIAENGKEAVEVFRENADDIVCVLLDLSMPKLNGEEVFCEIKKIKPDIKVILTSGYNEQEVTQKFTGKELAGFIQKPFGLQTLLEKVKQVCEKN
ncbi:PAS domain S-box protein [bacterium]|nr:PAS domain S-box protein [bacterium]